MDDFTFLCYLLLWALSIIFSILAIDRETILPSLLAGFFWLMTALITFILGPTTIGIAFGWVMGMMSFVFMGVFIWRIVSAYFDSTHVSREPRGPL